MLLIGVVPLLELVHWAGSAEARLDDSARAEDLEGWLEERSGLREMLLPRVQRVLHPLGLGNEQVYLGREGWLFYRPDVEHLTGAGFLTQPEDPGDDPSSALIDLHRQLAERGIRLLVVPVPGKASVYPEKLSPGVFSGLRNPSTLNLYRRLTREGVQVLDLLPELLQAKLNSLQPLYLATDTHWSPSGMHLAARLLAARIRPWLGPPSTWLDFRRSKAEIESRGDTARMLPFEENSHPVRTEKVTVRPVVDGQGNLWQPKPQADVLLLGDSFANIYSLEGMGWGSGAGLAEQISFELGRSLERIVRNGQGAWSTRRELQRSIRQGAGPLAGKKVVIFQFAARELSFGDWRLVDLPQGGQPASRLDPEKAPAGWLEVEGTVAARAKLPPASSTPYPDLITSIHLIDLRVRKGNLAQSEIVVFLWARRQGQSTPGADYQEGDRISLHLTEWNSVQPDFGRFYRVELDEPRLWDLPVFWALERQTSK